MHNQTQSQSQNTAPQLIAAWKWRVLALVAAAIFIVVLDFSVVNVALPSIKTQLHFTDATVQWVVSAYAIVFGGFLLLGGRCADLLGRRQVLLWGVAIFSVASLFAGLSGFVPFGRELLIFCRAVQGIGGALIGPAALSVINTTFDEGVERNRAMGVFGSIATAGFACGILLGGILTQHLGWPSIFFVNVPLGALMLVIAPRLVPKSADESQNTFNWKTLDFGGAITVTLSLMTLIYALSESTQLGWHTSLLGVLVSVALLVAFLVIETRVSAPLMPLSIFARRNLTTANIVMLLIEGINASTIYFLTFYLQTVQKFSPEKTGFAFLPLALWMIVASNLSPRIVTRFGHRRTLIVGTGMIALSTFHLTQLTANSAYLSFLLPNFLLAGTGIAAAITAGFITATMGLPDEDQGLASGLIQTSQQVGAALGLALLVAVANSHHPAGHVTVSSAAQVTGLRAAFLVGGFVATLSCLVAVFGMTKDIALNEESAPEPPLEPSAADKPRLRPTPQGLSKSATPSHPADAIERDQDLIPEVL